MTELLTLFATAFVAATLLPVSSEAVLAALVAREGADVVVLLAVATTGNVLGSVVNWAMGRWCLRFQGRRWFPIREAALDRAAGRMRRGGRLLLLLAWVPIVGDPLTFAAGVLRVRLLPFLVLVTIGKAARYVAITLGVQAWVG